jgi:pyruvate,water dikinase
LRYVLVHTMSRTVLDLADKAARREELAGGKASRLARLRARGLPVPPGFVITTRADAHGASPEIEAALRRLGGPVAVRSSLVGEEGRESSYAGQLDSVLDVHGPEQLLEAIRRCRASLGSERLTQYVRARGVPKSDPVPADHRLALLVQRMVPARVGGVAFGADPDTGQECVIIEAGSGLGDAVVAGRVQPDRYVVDAHGVLREVRPASGGQPLLAESAIHELARLVHSVSLELGAPQDVEWAWDGSTFHVLQARPITALARRHTYSRRLVADMAPGLVKPLYWSTNIRDMTENVFRRLFTELLGPQPFDYRALVRRIHSRAYADMTLVGTLMAQLGLPHNMFDVLVREDAASGRRPRATRRGPRAWLRLARVARRYGRIRRQAEAFVARRDRDIARYRAADWTDRPPAELLDEIRGLRGIHGETQWYMWLSAMSMLMRSRILTRLVRKCAPGSDASSLLAGYLQVASLEPNHEIRWIGSELAHCDSELVALARRGEDRAIREKLSASDSGRQLLARFDGFMERFGFLSASGTDFTVAPWIETPGLIWTSAVSTSEADARGRNPIGEDERRRVRACLPWHRRPLYDHWLRSTAAYLQLRERISFAMAEDAYQMRRLYLAIGEFLARDGVLARAQDLFQLFADELEALVQGTLDPAEARERVRARDQELEVDAGLVLHEVIHGDDSGTAAAPPPQEAGCLEGIPGSPGWVSGRARVVRSPEQLEPGSVRGTILVVPFMDIGWTPLFARIGGIVAETGGRLSHSAVVAREYGLPAVVGLTGVTDRIRDGQWITVDGHRGCVYLVDAPQ